MKIIIENDKIIIDGTEYVPVDQKKIKVGDKVKVVNSDKFYSLYYTWSEWENVPIEHVARYQYDAKTSNLEGKIATVVYIGPHRREASTMLAVVEINAKCYLINVDGLERMEK